MIEHVENMVPGVCGCMCVCGMCVCTCGVCVCMCTCVFGGEQHPAVSS